MSSAPPENVETWLTEQGFAQYLPLFVENAIDYDILPTLSEADLRSLGLPFGHARKLAMAAAKIGQTAELATPAPTNEAERRQLTVMFCDLVGSTSLSSRLDPEDLREIIQRYQKTCGEIIARYGGFVAQYLGDGIMVFFGYPQAQEDAAERAVRAGLEIIAEIRRMKTPLADIEVRIGAATGLAVVGDLIGKGSSEQTAVVGQTPNLAARVQSLADPGCMTIAESTLKLVGSLFKYRDLGPQRLKGIDSEVRVLQVLGESTDAGRFESIRSARIDCIGRQRELDFLMEKWRLALAGRGQVVLAWGEAGIGKSRLLRLLNERLESAQLTRIQAQCSPQHGATPLYPIIHSNQRAMKFSAEDSDEEKRDKIERFLTMGNLVDRAPLLAAMMSVPAGGRYPPLQLSAEQLKTQTLQMCVDFVTNLAARQPVLYQIEDAHWIDPSTEELLSRFVERIVDLPVLLLVTGRPECRPAWLGLPHVSALDLGRLGEIEIRMMVHSVAGKKLPEEVIAQILAKTDGIPLYVEELTRNVLESGLLTETHESWELAGPLPPMAIPSTLQDSLMARLDRLASAKEIIQVAALIGRRFSYSMLSAVLDYPESMLRTALDRLIKAELLFKRGCQPNDEYEFKHALIQDAAYESLLKSRRTTLHARIVRALETHFPQIVETQPELLAHHAEHADLMPKAIGYGLLAGQRALGRSAHREAIKLLAHAIDLLAALPENSERWATELDLQLALGQACMAMYGYTAPQTFQAFERARLLSEKANQPQQYYAVLYGMWANNTISGRLRTAADLAIAFLSRAYQDQDGSYQCVGHRLVGNTAFYRGFLFDAHEHLQRAIELYDPERHRALALRFGTDVGVTALVYLSWIHAVMGRPETAERHAHAAMKQASSMNHALSLAQALHASCQLAAIRRDFPALLAASQISSDLCEKNNLGYFRFWARNFNALAEAHLSSPDRLLAIRAHFGEMPEFNQSVAVWWFHCWVAEILLANGRPQAAMDEIDIAFGLIERNDERWGQAEAERIRGECLLALSPTAPSEAERSLRQAIDVARNVGTLTYELRAGISLYRLLAANGRAAEGKIILESIRGKFEEGFDLPEWRSVEEYCR